MKYVTTFILCLLRALYQGISTDKMLGFSKLHGEKTKVVGPINKARILVGRGRESSKSVWKPMWRGGVR